MGYTAHSDLSVRSNLHSIDHPFRVRNSSTIAQPSQRLHRVVLRRTYPPSANTCRRRSYAFPKTDDQSHCQIAIAIALDLGAAQFVIWQTFHKITSSSYCGYLVVINFLALVAVLTGFLLVGLINTDPEAQYVGQESPYTLEQLREMNARFDEPYMNIFAWGLTSSLINFLMLVSNWIGVCIASCRARRSIRHGHPVSHNSVDIGGIKQKGRITSSPDLSTAVHNPA
ncbi:hypothetical protein K461DRAFT_25588 [Myriangium duriaei CBS 260.36]|uniref:Uncharacterized protein n=1 Tax=Myriangium duriaei CBS 260.36 TaxID=1168546 RepID=A0A9P4MQ27_9PEZI|nr:hypothetical protein K461DRAFT_25588 [Myriangium duriaei CBS 260.36]